MDVAIRNPHPHFIHLDEVAIMEFSSSFSEETTVRPSNNQHRRNSHHSHEWFPRQPVHHRGREPEPRNVFSPFFTIASSEDGDTSFLLQNRNHHIHYHHQQQQQYNHFRNYTRPRRFNDVNENIPYEQLLELQERIGSVNTGLSEENITTCLKTRTVTSGDGNDEEIFNETCIVCQDEYKDHDTIGTLKCGHEYHRDCIKEWLLLKNVCPICKRSAQ